MLGQFIGFEGRVGRGTWWLGCFIATVLLALAWTLVLVANGAEANPGARMVFNLVSLGIAILAFAVSVCVTVKRDHDRDKSGWWWFIGLIPFIDFWQLIECGFCSGDESPNRFGPPANAAARRAGLEAEVAGITCGGAMARLDDSYMADDARKFAQQKVASVATKAAFAGGSAAPVFGKR